MDAAAGTGNIGEILRREGIYSSTLTGWRKEREAAVDTAFSQKRGPEPKHNPLTAENPQENVSVGACLTTHWTCSGRSFSADSELVAQ